MKKKILHISILLLTVFLISIGFSISGFHIHHHNHGISIEKIHNQKNNTNSHCHGETLLDHLFTCLTSTVVNNSQENKLNKKITVTIYNHSSYITVNRESVSKLIITFIPKIFLSNIPSKRAPPILV
jgi:hypothetical protein